MRTGIPTLVQAPWPVGDDLFASITFTELEQLNAIYLEYGFGFLVFELTS